MTPPNAPTASEYHAFVPVAREGATIAEDILSTTATMRQSGTFATSSLCWSPAELELLAMFAVDAKSQLLAARRGEELTEKRARYAEAALRDTPNQPDYERALDSAGLRYSLLEARYNHLLEHVSRFTAMAVQPMVIVQKSDGVWLPARPMRGSWEWRLRFSDWLEDVIIPRLRAKR